MVIFPTSSLWLIMDALALTSWVDCLLSFLGSPLLIDSLILLSVYVGTLREDLWLVLLDLLGDNVVSLFACVPREILSLLDLS